MEFTGFLAGQYHIGVYLSFFIITFYQLKYELAPPILMSLKWGAFYNCNCLCTPQDNHSWLCVISSI